MEPLSVSSKNDRTVNRNSYKWPKKTILVADDVPTNYLLIEATLKNTNAHLIWAKNGQEALDICMDIDVDIVLMDIQMPVMNGIEATRAIKAIKSYIPIVAQTALILAFDRSFKINACCPHRCLFRNTQERCDRSNVFRRWRCGGHSYCYSIISHLSYNILEL